MQGSDSLGPADTWGGGKQEVAKVRPPLPVLQRRAQLQVAGAAGTGSGHGDSSPTGHCREEGMPCCP